MEALTRAMLHGEPRNGNAASLCRQRLSRRETQRNELELVRTLAKEDGYEPPLEVLETAVLTADTTPMQSYAAG